MIIQQESEISLTNPLTNFEAYMFSSKPKFTERHVSFDNFTVVMSDGDTDHWYYDDAVQTEAQRAKLLTEFNNILKNSGVDPAKNASKVSVALCYFEEESRNESWYNDGFQAYAEMCIDFSNKHNVPMLVVTHPEQKAKGLRDMMAPHAHVLYKKCDEVLTEYIDQQIG